MISLFYNKKLTEQFPCRFIVYQQHFILYFVNIFFGNEDDFLQLSFELLDVPKIQLQVYLILISEKEYFCIFLSFSLLFVKTVYPIMVCGTNFLLNKYRWEMFNNKFN